MIVIFAIFVVTDFFYCVIYIKANGPRANGPDTTSANHLRVLQSTNGLLFFIAYIVSDNHVSAKLLSYSTYFTENISAKQKHNEILKSSKSFSAGDLAPLPGLCPGPTLGP